MTDKQAIDAIVALVDKSEPLPDLSDRDEVQAINDLLGDICGILCKARPNSGEPMDEETAESVILYMLGSNRDTD
jgi:hypothetical protein